MQRVLNDRVLSEVLKSQIPADTISQQYAADITLKAVEAADLHQVDTIWTPVTAMQSNTKAMHWNLHEWSIKLDFIGVSIQT